MATPHFLRPELFKDDDTFYSAVVTVTSASELTTALSQYDKRVVVESPEMVRAFSRLLWWGERRARFYFVAYLVYKLLALSIADNYQLEAEWHLKWKSTKFEGKIILTPIKR